MPRDEQTTPSRESWDHDELVAKVEAHLREHPDEALSSKDDAERIAAVLNARPIPVLSVGMTLARRGRLDEEGRLHA